MQENRAGDRPDVAAEISYLSADRGRKSGIQSGSWAHLHFQNETWHVWQHFKDTPWVWPGETHTVYLTFQYPLLQVDQLKLGTIFVLVEGSKVVAYGKVTELLHLSENAEEQRISPQ